MLLWICMAILDNEKLMNDDAALRFMVEKILGARPASDASRRDTPP